MNFAGLWILLRLLHVQYFFYMTLIFSYSLVCLAVQFTSLLEQLKALLGTGVVVKGQQTLNS